jgi:hypothetical protein
MMDAIIIVITACFCHIIHPSSHNYSATVVAAWYLGLDHIPSWYAPDIIDQNEVPEFADMQ